MSKKKPPPDCELPPFASGSRTSAAADSMQVSALPLRAQVYEWICSKGGMTDEELEIALELSHQTASARRNELMELGYVRDSGMERRNRSGRMAVVWVAGTQEEIVSDRPGGTTSKKRVRLPAAGDIQFTVDFLGGVGRVAPEVERVMAWLRFLATEGRG